ncbi:MAG TPA: CHAT domain-containing protein [Pyrinomonadaceae bacterium]
MSQLRLLSEAIKDLDSGYELCLATRYEEAARRFESARATFERVGDELEARLADYWIAYCLAQPGHLQESNALLNALDEFCGKRGYKWLQAQAAGWLASNHTALNELSSAIKDYRRSLALAEEISDTYQMQKALMGLGDSYSRLRQPEASLGYHYRSLALASRSNATPRQSWRNFTYTGGALFAFKYYDAAAAFISEALRLATTEFKDPSLAYLQYLNLGLIYSKLRRFDDAVGQAEIGLRIARSVRDQKSSQKPIANALLRQADIRRESGDCGQAVAQYDQAISLYEGMELDLYWYAAYKGRLLCERALGDDTAVGRDLPGLLRLFEKQRTQIREEENRNSFFDAEQGVYDIAVEYEYERQNYLGALEYAEAARARSLLDAVRSGARIEMTAAGPEVAFGQVSTPADLESVRQHMPPRLQVLMYTVLPTKLLVWRISRDQFSVFQKAVSADVLGADVNAYVNALTAERSGAVRPAATLGAKLFDTLLGPVIQTIKSGDVICIIPDKFLHRLSFAALISPDSGRYVVEDLAVFYAPSLNVLWHCSEASRKKAGSERGMVLSIGNPTFDPRAYPDLQPLRAAEREAREVADLYQRSSFLPGREATKARVLRDINSAEVIHFAGHYVIEGSSPLLSKMLLAGGGGVSGSEGQDSDLFAFEISLTSGSEAHYDTFPQGGPTSGYFNRNATENDPHDIRWMIDLAGPEPRHGRLIRLKPRSDERVGVTLARFHRSLFFTGKPSEKSVRFSPRRNGDPDGPGNFDLGPTNEEILGVLLATEPGEIRFDGLGIDPLPYDENRRYEIEIVNMDNQLAEKKHRFVKGDFHYFYDVIEVDGDQQELWAFPRATGRFTPDGDCNPEFVSLATLQPLIES